MPKVSNFCNNKAKKEIKTIEEEKVNNDYIPFKALAVPYKNKSIVGLCDLE